MRDNDDLNEDHLMGRPDEQSDEITLPPGAPGGGLVILKLTALLAKGDMLAVISLTCSPQANSVGCLDPRVRAPVVQTFSDPARADAVFRRAILRGEDRGWRVFYLGVPLCG